MSDDITPGDKLPPIDSHRNIPDNSSSELSNHVEKAEKEFEAAKIENLDNCAISRNQVTDDGNNLTSDHFSKTKDKDISMVEEATP